MTACQRQASGAIELYFYDELDARERADVGQHLRSCAECRAALEEMAVIRAALGSRAVIDAPAGGDWSPFMRRLGEAISFEQHLDGVSKGGPGAVTEAKNVAPVGGSKAVTYLAMAALLTLVTSGVAFVARSASPSDPDAPPAAAEAVAPAEIQVPSADRSTSAAFAALSERHFERSKLVVLGLANKDPQHVREDDWAYERGLASDLLSDTRLYRQVAEERGMKTIAGVMSDLELVLLQTSLAESPDADALQQIQRLIDKRGLVSKMDAAAGS